MFTEVAIGTNNGKLQWGH